MNYQGGDPEPKKWWHWADKAAGYTSVAGCVVVCLIAAMVFLPSREVSTPAADPVVDVGRTSAIAKAKCGEYEMDWIQITDVARIYKNRFKGEEAVVYCIDHETNVTIRELIPLIYIEEDDNN